MHENIIDTTHGISETTPSEGASSISGNRIYNVSNRNIIDKERTTLCAGSTPIIFTSSLLHKDLIEQAQTDILGE